MGRVWLVTGASSGFGRAITEAAVAAGGVVVAAARRPEALDDLVAAHPGRVEGVRLDVTDHAAINAVIADLIARHGQIDVLVNNAGRAHVGAAEETSDAELRSLFDVRVFGPAALTRAVLPHMRERGSGAIVQISSIGGQLSFAGFSAYSATKFALEGFSEALADEVGPLGIKVLIVEPGSFRTGLFSRNTASDQIADYTATVGETRRMIEASNGKQPGDPAKAAAVIVAALAADRTPLRLALGEDAIEAIRTHSASVASDIDAWEKPGTDTKLDELR